MTPRTRACIALCCIAALAVLPASAGAAASGSGHAVASKKAKKCKKGFVRKHGRCVRKARPKVVAPSVPKGQAIGSGRFGFLGDASSGTYMHVDVTGRSAKLTFELLCAATGSLYALPGAASGTLSSAAVGAKVSFAGAFQKQTPIPGHTTPVTESVTWSLAGTFTKPDLFEFKLTSTVTNPETQIDGGGTVGARTCALAPTTTFWLTRLKK